MKLRNFWSTGGVGDSVEPPGSATGLVMARKSGYCGLKYFDNNKNPKSFIKDEHLNKHDSQKSFGTTKNAKDNSSVVFFKCSIWKVNNEPGIILQF